jgi:phosphatidate cytidylyltransferase
MLGTWASDTFAYFVGCAVGKRKLCPNVSPNKSVEGAVAGFIGCLAVMVYMGVQVLDMAVLQAAALGLCVAVFAPLGDLVESILKRSFGVNLSGAWRSFRPLRQLAVCHTAWLLCFSIFSFTD